MVNSLVKKYLNNNLRVLAKIHKLSKKNSTVFYSEIEGFLNRGRNQVSSILKKLELDELIKRNKKIRPQQIKLTSTGIELIKSILHELS